MNKIIFLVTTLLVLPLLFGCGTSEREVLMEELLSLMNELADTLATIKDEASAKEAAPELKRLAEGIRGMKHKTKKLGQITPEEKKYLEKYYVRTKEASDKFEKEFKRLTMLARGNEELMRVLGSIDLSE